MRVFELNLYSKSNKIFSDFSDFTPQLPSLLLEIAPPAAAQISTFVGSLFPSVTYWVTLIQEASIETKEKYPFMLYGTGWVGFAHLVMVIACLGPLRDPVKNIWVLQFGLIGCILMIPMTLITGVVRSLPWFWQLFDCAIGLTGAIVFLICYRCARQMQTLSARRPLTSGNLKG
ncbi:MAG: hypothetical protein ACYSUC_00835 [Planctomycetota bacterium]